MSGLQTILFATTAVWGGIATLEIWLLRTRYCVRRSADQITIDELREELLDTQTALGKSTTACQGLESSLREAARQVGEHLKTINTLSANVQFAEDHWKSEYRKLELEHEALEGTNQRLLADLTHAQMEQSAARKGEEIALYNEAQAKLDLQLLVAEQRDKLQEALAKAPKPAKAVKKKGKRS